MLDPIQIAVFACAVCLTGLSKGGFSGLGMIATPLLAMVMDPLLAVSIMLPILLVQDALSVIMFRRTIDWHVYWRLVPGAIFGIGMGYVFASSLNATVVSGVIGAIAVIFAIYFLFKGYLGEADAPKPGVLFGSVCGAGAGFSSIIAHAGTPPFQVYVLPLRLARDVFVGTSVYFFATINVVKVVPYILLGQLSISSIKISATMVPVSLLFTFIGVWIVRRIDADRFYRLICLLLAAIGLKLIFDACADLL